MSARTFTRDELEDLDVPWVCIEIFSEVISHNRWSVGYRGVFKYEDKHYMVHWTEPATECQDADLFDYRDEIACAEVELREVVRTEWVPV